MFIGVLIGLAYSLLVLSLAPLFGVSLLNSFGLGSVMLFIMMGFTIGLVGIFNIHPIFGFKMHWWIRGTVAGIIFGFIYVSIGYESLSTIMQSVLMTKLGFSSPYWATSDFVVAGLIMAYFETKIAGQGPKLPLE